MPTLPPFTPGANSIAMMSDDLSHELALMLGDRVDCAVGLETSLYFEGLLPWAPTESWQLSITSEIGRHFSDRWGFTPMIEQVGRHPFTLRYCDPASCEVIAASCDVHVHSALQLSRTLRWLPIGDSITHALGYVEATVQRASQFSLCLTSVGSRGVPGQTRHEGYPGWKIGHFLGRFDEADANFRERISSPFLFGSDRKFSFSEYIASELGGEEPDLITIYLGTNDIALLKDDDRSARVEKSMSHARALIEEILGSTRYTRIGLIPPVNPASQDAFGINYGCLIPRWMYRKNQRAFTQALRANFGNYAPRVSIIPAHAQIDPVSGYPRESRPLNAHTDLTKEINTNAVHPSLTGHHQISTAVLSWMLRKD